MYPFSWTHITDRGFTLFKLNLFSLSVEIVSNCRLININVINEFRLNRCAGGIVCTSCQCACTDFPLGKVSVEFSPPWADVSVQSSRTTFVTVWSSTDSFLNSIVGLGHIANRAIPMIAIRIIGIAIFDLIFMIFLLRL